MIKEKEILVEKCMIKQKIFRKTLESKIIDAFNYNSRKVNNNYKNLNN